MPVPASTVRGIAHERKPMPTDEPTCSHEYVLGGVAYACERTPHPADGYGPAFRHAAEIDAELADGTDEGDGYDPATLVTWGEDGRGDGQDWEIGWGTVADYGTAPDRTQDPASRTDYVVSEPPA